MLYCLNHQTSFRKRQRKYCVHLYFYSFRCSFSFLMFRVSFCYFIYVERTSFSHSFCVSLQATNSLHLGWECLDVSFVHEGFFLLHIEFWVDNSLCSSLKNVLLLPSELQVSGEKNRSYWHFSPKGKVNGKFLSRCCQDFFFFCSLQVRSFTPMWFAKHFFGFILFVIH